MNEIVKYTYDAWGNHNIKFVNSNGDLVDFDANITYNTDIETNLYIALKNPFRYRSYYYDTETGLYYLNSRYYDPEIGRFINIDEITVLDVTNIALNGINLYAYCLNNPVNEVDESGYFILAFLISILVLGVVNVAIQFVGDVVNYAATGKWTSSWEDYVGAFIGGMAGGIVFVASGFNIGLTFATMSGVETFATSLLTNATGKTNYSIGQIVLSSFFDFAIAWGVGSLSKTGLTKNITLGRNSLLAVFKSGLRKLKNNTVKRMSLGVAVLGGYSLWWLNLGDTIKDALGEAAQSWIKYFVIGDKSGIGYIK